MALHVGVVPGSDPQRRTNNELRSPNVRRFGSTPRTLLIANPSADVYGSDLQMLQTVSAMAEREWRVVVAMPGPGRLADMLNARGAQVHSVPCPVLRRANANLSGVARLTARIAATLPGLYQEIRAVSPDVLYVNTVTIPWWLAAARVAGVPTICHVHEAESGDSKITRTMLNLPLTAATSLISISHAATTATTRDVPWLAKRVRLIYNGVPQPTEPISSLPDIPPFRLAVVGRLSPRKATHVAVQAVALLRERGRDVRLELCGTPFPGYEWYEDRLHRLVAENGLENAIQFSGYVSPIWPVLARTHALLAPSLREPFGNAVVEAQLSNRPVIAAAAMGHLESVVAEHTGLLVPCNDVSAMADAVERLMDNPHLAQSLASEALRAAKQRFSVARYRQEVADLITSTALRTQGIDAVTHETEVQ